ncbi:MAG: class I SAM-dependent DNA methyltransferase, partial [Methylococcales bacterium]
GQIHTGNALRLEWLKVCPPAVKMEHHPTDLFDTEPEQPEIDFEAQAAETYICGNPPYKGSQDQTDSQKEDLELAFESRLRSIRSSDYVAGWFVKAREWIRNSNARFAFVTTNSINQGRQVSLLWPLLLGEELEIFFAVPSFPWQNLASRKAVVTVSVVGMQKKSSKKKKIYTNEQFQLVDYIGAYLVPNHDTIVQPSRAPLFVERPMMTGSMANDNGGLLLDFEQRAQEILKEPAVDRYLKKFIGSDDAIYGEFRYCLWINDQEAATAQRFEFIHDRLKVVQKHRAESDRETTKNLAKSPHAFGEVRHQDTSSLLIPRHSSEDRPYLPCLMVGRNVVVADSAIFLPNFELSDLALYSSKLHWVWIATVCGKLKTDFRYSNTLGWNTFPVPPLTEKNKADLNACAEDILLAREEHFPATIADLYDPDNMPENLRRAHDRNDETLERIYIGRRFKNDTERLEKLFDLYTKMTAEKGAGKVKKAS